MALYPFPVYLLYGSRLGFDVLRRARLNAASKSTHLLQLIRVLSQAPTKLAGAYG